MLTFGDEVKRLADAKALTHKAIADACGVQPAFIGKLMRGEKKRLGADVLFKLAAALGVPTDHFRPFLAPDAATPAADSAPETTPPAAPPAGGKKPPGGGKAKDRKKK